MNLTCRALRIEGLLGQPSQFDQVGRQVGYHTLPRFG